MTKPGNGLDEGRLLVGRLSMRIFAPLAGLYLVFCSCASTAGAAEPGGLPVYNPASKSYFQFFSDNLRPGDWVTARKRAEMKVYKGVRGRLAEVHDQETHDFLVRAFQLDRHENSVWIGLRYWCNARLLQWGHERAFAPSEPDHFRIWLNPWQRDAAMPGGSCGMHASTISGFVPVYYANDGGFAGWRATGSAKYFDYYIVEYPTGGP